MTVGANPTLRRMQLGRLLREAREALGLSREEVAGLCNVSVSTVTQRENGKRGARLNELRPHMDAVKILDPDQRAALENLAREAKERGWWSKQAGKLRAGYLNFIGLEESAHTIFEYAALVIPGLLQTEEYAKAFMAADNPKWTDEQLNDRWQVRATRQERTLARVNLHVVLDEACLRRVVGDEDVWRAQLKHLLDLAEHRNITIQVLSFQQGSPAGATGGFTLLRLEDADYCYIELRDSEIWFEGADALRYTLLHDRLRTLSLPPGGPTAKLVDEVANLR